MINSFFEFAFIFIFYGINFFYYINSPVNEFMCSKFDYNSYNFFGAGFIFKLNPNKLVRKWKNLRGIVKRVALNDKCKSIFCAVLLHLP